MTNLGFFKRFSSSLFSPKDVIKYRTDRLWMTFLYFIFLLLISVLPVYISIVQNEGFSYETRRDIVNHYSTSEDLPFYIANGRLNHDDDDKSYIYNENITDRLKIIITLDEEYRTDISSTVVNILLREDGVYLSQSAFHLKLFSYDEYDGLKNFDFSNLQSRNSPSWDIIINVIKQEIKQMKPLTDIVQIVMVTLSEFVGMIFISLILAFFQSFTLTGVITFGKTWKMCIYALTPYVVGNVLGMLFGFPILFYLGLGVTAIFAASISQNILRESSGKDRNNDI